MHFTNGAGNHLEEFLGFRVGNPYQALLTRASKQQELQLMLDHTKGLLECNPTKYHLISYSQPNYSPSASVSLMDWGSGSKGDTPGESLHSQRPFFQCYPEDCWEGPFSFLSATTLACGPTPHPPLCLRLNYRLLWGKKKEFFLLWVPKQVHNFEQFHQLNYQAVVCNLDHNLMQNSQVIWAAIIAPITLQTNRWKLQLICTYCLWDQFHKQTSYSSKKSVFSQMQINSLPS